MTRLQSLSRLCAGTVILATVGQCRLRAQPAPASADETVITSWIGNTGGTSPSTAFQGAATDLWIDRDGTAFLTAPGDVGVRCLSAYRDGRCLGRYAVPGGLVLAGNRNHLFVGTAGGVRILSKDPAATVPDEWIKIEVAGDVGAAGGQLPDGVEVRGLCATEQHLYVSNAAHGRIEQWDLGTRRKVKDWPFRRPGALALDPREGLWAVRERELAPGFDALTRGWRRLRPGDVLEPAAVVRLRIADGTTLETLTEAEIPVALAVRPGIASGQPELLVADNGSRQQILVYSRKDARRSKLAPPIGNRQGFLGPSGQAPTDRRFNGLTGLGVSSGGALFVAQNWNVLCERRADYAAQCAELLEFSPGLDRLVRANQSLVAAQTATVDPSPPFDVHVRNVRFAMAWERPAGTEWSLAGRTTDPLQFPHDPAFLTQLRNPVIRHVQNQDLLFGPEGRDLLIYRRDRARYGEVWIPTGAICPEDAPPAGTAAGQPPPSTSHPRHASSTAAWTATQGTVRRGLVHERDALTARTGRFGWMWIDGRGADPVDGVLQLDETESLGTAWRDPVWSVDALGGIWLAARAAARDRPLPPQFTAWTPDRQDTTGIPLYRKQPPRRVPEPFAVGTVAWHRYDPGSNRMLIAGRTPHLTGGGIRLVCVYAGWTNPDELEPSLTLAQQVLLPHSFDDSPSAEDLAAGVADVVGLDVVGDRLFALQPAPLRVGVYDLNHGNRVATLSPEADTEVAAPPTGAAGLRAFAREDGEIIVLLPDVAGGRLFLLRWRPSDRAPTPPTVAPTLDGTVHPKHVRLFWSTPDTGVVLGYHVYRSAEKDPTPARLTRKPVAVAFFEDSAATTGQAYDYSVSIVNESGEGPRSHPLRLVPAAAVARFVGEDRTTLGDWRERYGALGYHLFGDAEDPEGAANPRYPDWLGGVERRPGSNARRRRPELRRDPALPLRAAPGHTTERVAGVLPGCADRPAIIPIEIRNGRSVRTSVYCGSSEQIHGVRIEIVDADADRVLDAREFCNEEETSVRGRYLTWDITGSVLLRVTAPQAGGQPDLCGINAIFFDDVTSLARP
jgi:hypothetical protein